MRQTREQRGLELAFAAKSLRIRLGYLQAIEDKRYGDLPGHAYAVGFVRGYSEFLGLDSAEIVRLFKDECDAFAGRTELVFPTAVSESSIPGGWLLALALVAAVVAYGAWYIYQSRTPSLAESVPALPERLSALIHQPVGNGSEIVAVPRQDIAKPSESAAPVGAPPVSAPPVAAPAVSAPSAPIAQTPPVHEDVVPPAEDEAPPSPPSANVPEASQPLPLATDGKPLEGKAAAKALREAKKAEAAAAKAARNAPGNAAAVPPPASLPPVLPPANDATPSGGDKLATVETVRQSDTIKSTARPSDPAKPIDQDAAALSPSRVVLRAEEDCWIEIRDSSGQVIHSRLLRKGETYAVPGRSGLVLTAGNAGAMTVVVDGKQMPALGRMGMVRRDVSLDPERLTQVPGE